MGQKGKGLHEEEGKRSRPFFACVDISREGSGNPAVPICRSPFVFNGEKSKGGGGGSSL